MKKFLNQKGSRLKKQNGFVKTVILIIAGLVLLKYLYDVDIVGYLTEGRFREILDKIYAYSSAAWAKYGEMIAGIWNYIVSWFKN